MKKLFVITILMGLISTLGFDQGADLSIIIQGTVGDETYPDGSAPYYALSVEPVESTIKYIVKSAGSETVSPVRIEFYLSKDSRKNSGDWYLGYAHIPSLSQGEFEREDKITLPSIERGVLQDNYNILIIVDADDKTEETDERNNTGVQPLKLNNRNFYGIQFWEDPYENKKGRPGAKLSDLCFFENIVKAERNSESVFFQIKPNISNKGDFLSTPVEVYYYLSTDKKLDVEDKLLIRSQIPKINAGKNYRANMYETVSIPELEIKHRTVYYVIGFIDPQHKIHESDEDNNKIYIEVRGLD